MAYPASMEVPLIGCSDGQSRKRGVARSLAIAAGGVVAMVIGGFLMINPFHNGGADSVPSESAESSLVAVVAGPVCKPNWCKRHGYEEDACNCGVCGSYGGCSWTCDPTQDEALHRLRSCTSSAWYEYDEVVASFRDPITWFGAIILASGFVAIVFSVIRCKAYFRRTPVKKMADDEYLVAESIVSDSTSARSVGVFDETPIKIADFNDSSSEQSSKDRDVADADILEHQISTAPECQISDSTSSMSSKVQSPLDQDSVVDEADHHGNPTIPDFQCQTKEPTSFLSCSNCDVVDTVQYHAHRHDEPKLPELLAHTNIKDLPNSPREVVTTDAWKASTQAVLLEAFHSDEPVLSQMASDIQSKDLLPTPQNKASAETSKSHTEAVPLDVLCHDEPVLPQTESHMQLNDWPLTLSAVSKAAIEAKIKAEMDVVVKTLEPPRVTKAIGHAQPMRSRSSSLPLPRSNSVTRFASCVLPVTPRSSVTRLARGVSPMTSATWKQQSDWETASSTTCEDSNRTSLLSRNTSCQSTTAGTSLLSQSTSFQSATQMAASTTRSTLPSYYTKKEALPYTLAGTTGVVGTKRAVTPVAAGHRWAETPPPVASRATTPLSDKKKPIVSMKSKSACC